MTHVKNSLSAMTAIAAVLACATPALAQEVTPAPVTATPEPVASTPPAAETAPSTPTPATPVTTSDPLSPAVSSDVNSATPATTTRATRTSRPATRNASRARPATTTAARSTPVRVAAPVSEPAATAPIAPIAAAPLAVTPTAALPAPAVEPTPAPPPVEPQASASDILPIAGAAGLGLLGLIGAGVFMRRRKRRAEEEKFAASDEPYYEQPVAPAAYDGPVREPSIQRDPIFATPVAATPVAATAAPVAASAPIEDAPTNELPEGFDLSRFGPHVQAAYSGPTEDNPSLSLKNRLRRASALDQMARNDDTAPAVAPGPVADAVPARDSGAVVSKIRPAAQSSGSFILGGGGPSKPRPVTQH